MMSGGDGVEEDGSGRAKSRSFWADVEQAPPDGLLALTQRYLNDPSEQKLNIGVGAYRTEEGKPYLLNVIRKAEKMLLEDETRSKEYLPQAGDPEFCSLSQKLAFGDCPRSTNGSIITLQSISGSGSIRVIAELIKRCFPGREIYVSDPAWIYYHYVFPAVGLQMRFYRYWDPKTKGLDIEGLLEDLRNAAPGSIVVFQACAHNPTGVDPTKEDWQRILKVVQSKELLPLVDTAYQGFATGDLDADAYAPRLFEGSGMDLILALSYSKNMGLYGERAGCLSVVCQNPQDAARVKSKLEGIIVELYATPPRHGAALAAIVLKTPDLFEEWQVELGQMVSRIRKMREELHKQLLARETPGDWSCLLRQTGMFAYSGLSLAQVKHLTEKWHIYLADSGRFSMAGLSVKSCSYLADAVDDAVRNV